MSTTTDIRPSAWLDGAVLAVPGSGEVQLRAASADLSGKDLDEAVEALSQASAVAPEAGLSLELHVEQAYLTTLRVDAGLAQALMEEFDVWSLDEIDHHAAEVLYTNESDSDEFLGSNGSIVRGLRSLDRPRRIIG